MKGKIRKTVIFLLVSRRCKKLIFHQKGGMQAGCFREANADKGVWS